VLVRLNGKSQKHGSPPTEVTLLSGLFVLLRLFDLLELMDDDVGRIAKLKQIAVKCLPTMRRFCP
ncbi:MAG: hypothetical protein LBU65_06225, partial [Planctomycetaceae bacterium]|nr:hypothetical protein [Planctomycetaceae bacterium]